MKIRNGFVSNSSSSAFILDASNENTKKYLKILRDLYIEKPQGLGRSTALAVGKSAKEYADYWISSATWYYEGSGLGAWINMWYDKLGENTVFLRISDEGMGGHAPYPKTFNEGIILSEIDYH